MLKTETNTPAMERRIKRAALIALRADAVSLNTVFEHGQWWIVNRFTGAQWSVVDAEGGPAIDGFDFEQVTFGDDE